MANAGYPDWRVGERLALAEGSVWELLHQGEVRMLRGGGPVGGDCAVLGDLVRGAGGPSGARSDPARRLGDDVGNQLCTLGGRGEQEAVHAQQALDVVDVVVELRDQQQRAPVQLARQTGD